MVNLSTTLTIEQLITIHLNYIESKYREGSILMHARLNKAVCIISLGNIEVTVNQEIWQTGPHCSWDFVKILYILQFLWQVFYHVLEEIDQSS